jgi:glycosyltransferase involved in cell wall biosynthesis
LSVIGIDARAAAEEPAGRGRYVRELLQALSRGDGDHTYELYARTSWDGKLDERFRWHLIPSRDPVWHLRVARAASASCGSFLSTNSYLTAWFTRIPCAVVVFDLVPFQPEIQARRSSTLIERATIARGIKRAALVICISEATRRDLVSRYPAAGPRTRVIPLAADERFAAELPPSALEEVRSRHGLNREFVLCTGTIEPRKNLVRVLEAHAALSHETQLALVGPRGWEFEPILERAAGAKNVSVLGEVSDDDLAALYRACTVFCYPSLYEGFGLPLLEAMAAGAACVTSSVTSLPEVGGDAVVYVEPTDVAALRAALDSLLGAETKRAELGRMASRRASLFSWDRTAAETLAALVSIQAR